MEEMVIWNHHARLAGRLDMVDNRAALEAAKRKYDQKLKNEFWLHSIAARAMTEPQAA